MLSLFTVASHQKKGRGVWAWVNSYQRDAVKGWGGSPCARGIVMLGCSPTSAALHPLEAILSEQQQS